MFPKYTIYILLEFYKCCLFFSVYDASSKLPIGVFDSNFHDIGNFDQCYAYNNPPLRGKYCLGILNQNNETMDFEFKMVNSFSLHVCDLT